MTTTEDKSQETSLHGPNLILDVENFGPIAEAKNIEFKPMTVFVGPSNTGKTYLAKLTHALLRARSESSAKKSNIAPIRELDFANIDEDSVLAFIADLGSIVRLFQPSTREDVYDTTLWIAVKDLPPRSRRFLQKYAYQSVDLTAARYEQLILGYFEVDSIGKLSSFDSVDQPEPTIRFGETTGNWQLSPDRRLIECDVAGTFYHVGGSLENMLRRPDFDGGSEIYEEALRSLVDYSHSVANAFVQSYYFPAERSGILTSRHVLAQLLTARDQKINLLYRDFLSELVGVKQPWIKPVLPEPRIELSRRQLGTNAKVLQAAGLMENSVLQGEVIVANTTGLSDIYFTQHDDDGARVPVEVASSMVSDLTTIVLFLRHYIQVGDLLIIDEPEAHLHPEAQQQMAAALAFMVRSGLRVLITTHSHYMVEQLSNFVMASKVDDLDDRKRLLDIQGALGEEDVYLKPRETAVYDFAPQSQEGGSVVKEVPFEDGYYPEDHMRAISRQFNRNNRIESAVLDSE